MTATTSKKFLFETSFEPEELAARAAAIPLETHALSLQAEYAKGLEQGHQEAQAGIDAQNTHQLQELNQKIADLVQEQEQYRHKVQVCLAQILQKSLEKLFPALAQEGGIQEALRVVEEAFQNTPPGREMTVHVCPPAVAALQEKLTTFMTGVSSPVTFKVVEDPALSYSDCRVTWEGGGLERLSARLYQEIDGCLQRLGVTETIETPEFAPDQIQQKAETTNPQETLEKEKQEKEKQVEGGVASEGVLSAEETQETEKTQTTQETSHE